MFEAPSKVKPAGKIVEPPEPTLERFVKHAKRFGVERVFETARDHLTDQELRTLDAELSRIDTKRKRLFPDDAKSELDTQLLELAKTQPVAQVAREVAKSKSYVYAVLRTAAETGSNPSMSTEETA